MRRQPAGFTLPELMITIVLLSLLVITVIGASLTWLNQFAIGGARQTMTIDMQAALSRISDDIRQSRGVLVENIESDPNAPVATSKWRSTTSQLVFGKTPYHTNGTGLYDIPALFSGKPDSVVYYVRDGTLYRRVIPANYPGNATLPLLTCSGPVTGGCPGDHRILSNVTALQFTYFDSSNASGADPASTRSVEVNLTTARSQSGHTVTVKDKVRVNPPLLATIIPPTTGGGGEEPPGPTQSSAGLVTGPGGLQLAFSNITGRDAYIRGRLMLSNMSTINLNTYRMDVANVGCGTRATFPVTCSGLQPIAISFFSTAKAAPICATSTQTVTYGLTGLQAGCVPPNHTTPTFNKSSFTSTLSAGPASVNCTFFNPATLAANTRIDGDVTGSFCNKLTVSGNVYIKGNLNLSGFSTLQVAEGVTVRPVIVVNRQVTIATSSIKANSAGVRPYIISFYSANTTCSTSDSCTSVSNPEIYDSVTTSPAAININNYSTVNASLYSFFGTLNIETSNVTGALAGQEIIVGTLSGVQLLEGKWPT